jgi:hypothetical protein
MVAELATLTLDDSINQFVRRHSHILIASHQQPVAIQQWT